MMQTSVWLWPALCVHVVALAWVFLLSALHLGRYPLPFFKAWVFSHGWRASSALAGVALALGLVNPVWTGVALAGMVVGAVLLLDAALLYRGRALSACGRGLLIALPLLSGAALWGFTGPALDRALLPGFIALTLAQGAVAVAFWSRSEEDTGFGARLVSLIAGFWALESLFYPWCMVYNPTWIAPLQALSGLLTVTAGMGMVSFLLERSLLREQKLGRELSARNHDLLQTLEALALSRSEAASYTTAAREQGALVRQIVHDLRNANQAMQLIAESISDAVGNDARVQAMVAALERQLTFVANFLREKLVWIAGQERGHPPGTSLRGVFEALLDTFTPIYASKSQKLEVTLPESDCDIRLSAIEMDQILGNLLRNAHQHTPRGSCVRVSAACSDGWAVITVTDNGPGVPLALQSTLGRTAPRADGSGIGLANVYELVTRSGGAFGINSEPGQGSTFYVRLPLRDWGEIKRDGEALTPV